MDYLEQYEQKRLIRSIQARIETLSKKKTKKNKQEIELLKEQLTKLNPTT